jgi:hypothetical protein
VTVTTLRDRLLPRVQAARARVGTLGMHQVPVTLRSWTMSSGKTQTGTPVLNPDLVLGAADATGTIWPPHVRGEPTDVEIKVEYITPAWSNGSASGGYSPSQLAPADQPAGFTYVYVVAWPSGARNYILGPRGLDTTKPLHYTLHLKSTDRKVPY